jgi:hypothetical protein
MSIHDLILLFDKRRMIAIASTKERLKPQAE